jgi:hypothetical protein
MLRAVTDSFVRFNLLVKTSRELQSSEDVVGREIQLGGAANDEFSGVADPLLIRSVHGELTDWLKPTSTSCMDWCVSGSAASPTNALKDRF